MSINVAKIYSVLGSSSSLVPLAVKDSMASLGMTCGSYVTGKEEGFDRLIDEFGTEIIWLGGIPVYRWLFDKTVFKAYGLDGKFDARNLKDNAIFKKTKEYAPDENVKKAIEKIETKQNLFKKLSASKFVVSTVLAITSYVVLTKFKQKYTENQIKKELISEYQNKQEQQNVQKTSDTDIKSKDVKAPNEQKSPQFKSLASIGESLAYNAVKNMWIVDGAITAERLSASRSSQEFIGYSIKEAFSIMFLYFIGGKVQQMLEDNAVKKHNKNISLDARVLEDNYMKEIFANDSIKKDLDAFNQIKSIKSKDGIKKDPLELYNFLHKNPENAIVKMAKQSDIIKTYNKTNKIDTRAYIDLDNIESLKANLEKIYEQYKAAIKNGESPEKFFEKVKKLKRGSILTNIGVSVFALGVLTPAVMLFKRKFFDKDSEFQTKKDIREQLIKDGVIS